jgi:hypothetical protein
LPVSPKQYAIHKANPLTIYTLLDRWKLFTILPDLLGVSLAHCMEAEKLGQDYH